MQAKRAEEIPAILANTKNYPTPVRFVGGDYSQTRCVGGDGGTTVNLSPLGKIIEFGEDEVRCQAGVRVGALVRALAERGQELPLTPEMGQMTVGAVAVTTLPQASQAQGPAQMSALVKELKLITPQGKLMTVTERNADLMRVLSSSFGLLGVVHEVVLRVQPLVPVQNRPRGADAQGVRRALLRRSSRRLAHCACTSRRSTTRSRSSGAPPTRARPRAAPASGKSRNPSCATCCRRSARRSAACSPRPASREPSSPACSGRCARRSTAPRAASSCTRTSGSATFRRRRGDRATPTPCGAFRRPDFPKLLAEYFAFCRSYYKQHGYRCNVVNGASRLHQDRSSLFSVSFQGPMITLEPSSTGDRGWDEFLIDFNDFASALGGVPTFNQSRALKPEHVAKAFGDRVKLFRALRQRTDPLNRLCNSYFAHLLET